MSWSIGPFIGTRQGVLEQVEATQPGQEQGNLAKEFIVASLRRDQSWGNTGVKVHAWGHSGREQQYAGQGSKEVVTQDVHERHADCQIHIEHFKLALEPAVKEEAYDPNRKKWHESGSGSQLSEDSGEQLQYGSRSEFPNLGPDGAVSE
jgi:hypothetical protein